MTRGAWAAIVLMACRCAFGLNPALDVSQYAHTSWKIRDGFPKGQIHALAQTSDGYLWLGSEFGLFRFDGVKSLPWQPPADQHLPSKFIIHLLSARDGTLWIGTSKGLASWKDGRLTQYPELAGFYIFAIVEDREGSIWASGVSVPRGKLCAIGKRSVRCRGEDGVLGRGAFNLYEDRKGNLWAGVKNGLWRWKPGPPTFFPLDGEPDGIQGLGEDDDGTLLVGWNGALWRFVDGKRQAYPLPRTTGQFRAKRLLRDRDGALWIGTSDRGLVHVHQGRADVFAVTDSLSGENVYSIFADREGSIWVSTMNGLDRFRDLAVSNVSTRQGLSSNHVTSIATSNDESVWLATRAGISRWMRGQIMNYGTRRRAFATDQGERARSLKELAPMALFRGHRGRIWAATVNGFGYVDGERFVALPGVPGGPVNAIAEDTTGSLWIANQNRGLFQVLRGSVVQRLPWSRFGEMAHASALAADPSGEGVWIGFHFGSVAYFNGNDVRASYSTSAGLGEGRVNYLGFDQRGVLWAATEGGVSRLKDGRVATLTTGNGLPCDGVHWIVEDDVDSYWLYTACGLVRISGADLDIWAAAADKREDRKQSIQVTVFDESSGVRSLARAGYFSGQVAKSVDGKLWFLPWDGVAVVDPRNIPINQLPPPVQIEQIIADRKPYDGAADGKGLVRLPPLIRDLRIDYTALSLVAPDKVRFRYKLEGHDSHWHDAGNRRQAFYNDLPPRSYRFRVVACNNDGVWNDAGASLAFSVAPAYYQTPSFKAGCILALLATMWGLYRYRLRQIAREFNLRLEERVGERTRVARDLHDTLLQGFQGLMLRLQVVDDLLPAGRAKEQLQQTLERADQAIAEGRSAVYELRSSATTTNDLAQALKAVGDELTTEDSATFHLVVEGRARDLHPIIRDELYRISREALRNAFSHARAQKVETEITYGERAFRLRIRDDGKGIPPEIVKDGRPGHYGLPGMRERAKQIGCKLDIWSGASAGTEIELSIAGPIAYGGSTRSRFFRLLNKKVG